MLFPELFSVKTRRKRIGINQKELADIAGVSQSLIAKLEKEKLEPSYSVARKIFNTLDKLEHQQEKKCRDIMTKKVISVKKTDKIEKASEILKKNVIDQAPVLDRNHVIGSISESIIFNKLLNIDKKKLFSMKTEEIMKEPFPIVSADMPVSVILPLLKTTEAVLVKENKKLSGIITKANLI